MSRAVHLPAELRKNTKSLSHDRRCTSELVVRNGVQRTAIYRLRHTDFYWEIV